MIYPSELDLLCFFGTEPEESGEVSLYRVTDTTGTTLELSFSIAGDSLQTALHVGGCCICLVSYERISIFLIDMDVLRTEFEHGDYDVKLCVVVHPTIRVEWTGLLARESQGRGGEGGWAAKGDGDM